MKKKPTRETARNLDKPLVESGMLCRKRLWLDYRRPLKTELSASRRSLSQAGETLLKLARSVFPKGVSIEGASISEAAAETRRLLEEGTPVLFGATFDADGAEVECDILVRHQDGTVDLYEIKSGTKITQRYLNDLALQAHVLGASGFTLRAAFLLHQNPKYSHEEGAEYPPMQLLRSADVTAKVMKQVPHVAARLAGFRKLCSAETMPEQPMGSYCAIPSPCPYIDECSAAAPKTPAYQLPELTRQLEMALQQDGIQDLTKIDPEREGLTFAQRRTIESVTSGKPIIEDFVREELQHCSFPLHFLSLATILDALPRFDGQRPWRRTPYAWAVHTLFEDGRVQRAAFTHAERTDPRSAVMTALGKQVEIGGTLVCWDAESIESLRALLEDLPTAKIAVRAVIGRALVDMMQLFDAGVFHPDLRGHGDFAATVKALLDDDGGSKLPVKNRDELRELLEKAWAPRVRSTTREKIARQIEESLTWRSDRMLALYREFADFEAEPARAEPKPAAGPAKALPKLPEE